MFSKLLTLYSVVDQTVARIRQNYPAEVTCYPGCADCCHAVFDLSAVEAVSLASLLSDELTRELHSASQQALEEFRAIIQAGENPATSRIRCPLLSPENTCLCYEGRPVNCRTYGTPTVIDGQAHVCGLSGFDKGLSYPTINLAPLQQSLHHYSVTLCGAEFGEQRFPVAQVILEREKFRP